MEEIDAKILEPVADKLKIKKSSLPKLLIFWGLFGIILNIFWLINSLYPLPRLLALDTEPSFWWQYVLYIFFIVLSAIELAYGLKLNRQEKQTSKNQKFNALLLLLIPLFLSILLSPLSVISTLHFFAPKKSIISKPVQESVKSEQKTNWKTYINEVMRFSIKIPPGWYSHKEDHPFNRYDVVFSYPTDTNSPQSWAPNEEVMMEISVYPNNGINADNEAKERLKDKMMNLTLGKSIIIDRKKGVVLENINEHFVAVIMTEEDQNYMFTVSTPVVNGGEEYPAIPLEKYLPTFYQILSTFRSIQ
jgi:hypothetical protein